MSLKETAVALRLSDAPSGVNRSLCACVFVSLGCIKCACGGGLVLTGRDV